MGSSDAERAKRYRRHKAGDHSLCLPERCREKARAAAILAGAEMPPNVTKLAAVPEPVESRGDTLRRGLSADRKPSPSEVVLIEEAGRIADRLDRLADQLDRRAWLRMRIEDMTSDMDEKTIIVKVSIDSALSESRQQALALKAILAELDRMAAQSEAPDKQKQVNPLAALTSEIAARRNNSAP